MNIGAVPGCRYRQESRGPEERMMSQGPAGSGECRQSAAGHREWRTRLIPCINQGTCTKKQSHSSQKDFFSQAKLKLECLTNLRWVLLYINQKLSLKGLSHEN